MKIAIIGAGNVGGALGRAWSSAGHEVLFAVRNPSDPKAQAAVAGAGGRARAVPIDAAVHEAEAIVLAVPFGAVASVLEGAGPLAGKILVDCTNPVGVALPPDASSGAELVARLAPGARVVKSFNAQGAENIAHPRYGSESATNFYCGDDDAAKQAVRKLVLDVGFDPIDAGPLKNARLLEAATLLWFAVSRTLETRHTAFRILRDA
jgi:predicted dinucleotide-binding enzyme